MALIFLAVMEWFSPVHAEVGPDGRATLGSRWYKFYHSAQP